MRTSPLFLLLFTAGVPAAAFAEAQDRTAAPHFELLGPGTGTRELLPLEETRAEVVAAGPIAEVRLKQVYRNRGTRPIEAVYVFPGSTRAAIGALEMKIGARTVVARIQKRADARAAYEEARQAGQTASLLEQERPNVFRMNVANILPGDRIEVALTYTELLVPEQAVYELVVPAVVGPRYAGAAPAEDWVKNPYLAEGQPPDYRFGASVQILAGTAIRDVASPSHPIETNFVSPNSARIALVGTDGGNRDFVLRYRLADQRIETGVLLFPEQNGGYFLWMMEPPKQVPAHAIPPREYVFVVDVSGSMHGFPLDVTKQLMRSLLGKLRPIDTFNVLLFSGGNRLFAERSVRADAGQIENALALLGREQGGGGTELRPALERALALPRDREVSTTIVVVTDGYVQADRETLGLVASRLGEANVFAFGIGASVNRFLIESLARAGQGEPFVVLSGAEAEPAAQRFQRYIASPLLTRIQVQFEGFEVSEVWPKAVPDLFAERPLVVLGKYRGRPSGQIRVSGQAGAGAFEKTIPLAGAREDQELGALEKLWARRQIEYWNDQRAHGAPEAEGRITELGLRHALMSEFTSFVAIDSERRAGAPAERVTQPLPLPQGVSGLGTGSVMMSRGGGGLGYVRATLGGSGAPNKSKRAEDRPAAPAPEPKDKSRPERVRSVRLVSGVLAPEAVRAQLEVALAAAGCGGGRIRVELAIGADGSVRRVWRQNGALDPCLVRRIEALRFAPSQADSVFVVELSL